MIQLCSNPARRACIYATVFLNLIGFLCAQSATVGTIEGRVFNPSTGEYVENARITILGTALETLTDSSGQ